MKTCRVALWVSVPGPALAMQARPTAPEADDSIASVATVGALAGWAFAPHAGERLIPARGFDGLFYLAAAMGLAAGGAILLLARRERSDGCRAMGPRTGAQAEEQGLVSDPTARMGKLLYREGVSGVIHIFETPARPHQVASRA
jgi:hypothetical protein